MWLGTVQNTLKGGGIEKKGGETKILKKGGGGGQARSRGWDFKKGAGTPLRTMLSFRRLKVKIKVLAG